MIALPACAMLLTALVATLPAVLRALCAQTHPRSCARSEGRESVRQFNQELDCASLGSLPIRDMQAFQNSGSRCRSLDFQTVFGR